ncbi:hypothetical protein B0O80DRAFT_450765 [Mortierella sp. GBAus27b]|nr:hypothetical protein B0O80DRAFT_450765 [Mortierella sp. GBAus27b]
MDTHVRIGQSDKTNGFKYAEIFCHYGWTFKTLRIMNGALNDHLAILLDQSSQEKGSRIRTLVVDLKSLSAVGLNFVDQVIRRSNDLEEFTVICSTSDILRDRESAHWFLTQHSKVLTGLEMKLSDPDELKLWPEQVFLSKGSLSGLTDLQLTLQGVQALDDPHPFVQRLVEMVTSSSPSSATIDAALKKSSGRPKDTPETRSLKRFCLRGAVLTRDEWKWILEAIDLSTMEELDFQDTNFSSEEFKILARCFETLGSVLLLKNLDLKGTTLGGTVPVALRGKFESMVSEGIHISLI